jgi:hypothetical protein
VKLNHFSLVSESGINYTRLLTIENFEAAEGKSENKLRSPEKQTIKTGFISDVGISDNNE